MYFTEKIQRGEKCPYYRGAGSVSAKLRLARLMGVGGVSFWRLGEMPEGVK